MSTQNTDVECHNCKDNEYVVKDGEMWCDECGFTPHGSFSNSSFHTAWDQWEYGRRQARKDGRRPYCVGGAPSAYKGDGEYEMNDDEFNTPPRYKFGSRRQ